MISINPIESAFHELISFLKETKMNYLLMGGLAVLALGQPRMTQDIDRILFIEKQGLPAFLKKASKKFQVHSQKPFMTRGAFFITLGKVPVDVMIASTEWEQFA